MPCKIMEILISSMYSWVDEVALSQNLVISPATLSEILMKALELQVSLSFYRKKLRRTHTGMSSVVSN